MQLLSILKETVTEKRTELDHTSRRIEQYENDIKNLRCNIIDDAPFESDSLLTTEVDSSDNADIDFV